jgi:hypothetical protein
VINVVAGACARYGCPLDSEAEWVARREKWLVFWHLSQLMGSAGQCCKQTTTATRGSSVTRAAQHSVLVDGCVNIGLVLPGDASRGNVWPGVARAPTPTHPARNAQCETCHPRQDNLRPAIRKAWPYMRLCKRPCVAVTYASTVANGDPDSAVTRIYRGRRFTTKSHATDSMQGPGDGLIWDASRSH